MPNDQGNSIGGGGEQNEFNFPFKPYLNQVNLMRKIYETIEERKIGIFSSPTGTGKSLSIICSCLTWLKENQINERKILQMKLNNLSDNLVKLDLNEDKDDWVKIHSIKKKILDEKSDYEKQFEKFKLFDQRSIELKERNANYVKFNKRINLIEKRKKSSTTSVNDGNDTSEQNVDQHDNDELIVDYTSDDDENESKYKMNCDDENDLFNDEDEKEKQVKPYIIYASRTHSQLTQFINEIKRTKFSNQVRLVTLGSRVNLCCNENVLKLKFNHLINEKCIDLKNGKNSKQNHCKYLKNKFTNINEFKDDLLGNVLDIEELATIGKQINVCSYYTTRAAIDEAEILVIPYNILLNKETLNSFKINLTESIIIIDEAHNLLETIISVNSCTVTGKQLTDCQLKLNQYLLRYKKRLNPKNLLYIKQLLSLIQSLLNILITNDDSQSINDKKQNNIESNYQSFTITDFTIKAKFDNINIFKLLGFCEKSQIARKLHGFNCFINSNQTTDNCKNESSANGLKAFLDKMKSQQPTKKKQKINSKNDSKQIDLVTNSSSVLSTSTSPKQSSTSSSSSSSLYPIIELMRTLINKETDGKIIVTREKNSLQTSTIKFLLLDPSHFFKDIIEKSRSIILIGGTLEPITQFTNYLFKPISISETKINTFNCGHIIPDSNLLPISLGVGLDGNVKLNFSFKNRNQSSMIKETGSIIEILCKIVPGGIIIFFPSYDYLEKVYNIWLKLGLIEKFTNNGKRVFRESRNVQSITNILTDYKRCISLTKGGLLISVIGGRMSEGINFSDSLGRCVVIIGLPFANVTAADIKEKINFYEKQKHGSGQQYYLDACMKAVNQSIGRSIRHINDYSTILLLDERYLINENIKQSIPNWIKDKMICSNNTAKIFNLIENFFKNKQQK